MSLLYANNEAIKQHYKDMNFDSYFLFSRIHGALAAGERFIVLNTWSKVIPDIFIYRFFRWYQNSKIGWFLYRGVNK